MWLQAGPRGVLHDTAIMSIEVARPAGEANGSFRRPSAPQRAEPRGVGSSPRSSVKPAELNERPEVVGAGRIELPTPTVSR